MHFSDAVLEFLPFLLALKLSEGVQIFETLVHTAFSEGNENNSCLKLGEENLNYQKNIVVQFFMVLKEQHVTHKHIRKYLSL